jgi:hypothetical protein
MQLLHLGGEEEVLFLEQHVSRNLKDTEVVRPINYITTSVQLGPHYHPTTLSGTPVRKVSFVWLRVAVRECLDISSSK